MKLQTNQPNPTKRQLVTLLGLLLILSVISLGGWNLTQHPPLKAVTQLFNWLDRYDISSAQVQVEMLPTQEMEINSTIQFQPTQRSGRWLVFALNPQRSNLQASIGNQPVQVRNLWALNWILLPKEYRKQDFTLTLHYQGQFSSVSAEHNNSYIQTNQAFLRTDSLWFPMQANQLEPPKINCSFISPATASVITGGQFTGTKLLPEGKKVTHYQNIQAFQFVMGAQQETTYQLDHHTLHLYLLPESSQLADPIAQWTSQILQRYTEWYGPLPEYFQEITIVQETGYNPGLCDQNMIILGSQYFQNLTLERETTKPLVTDRELYELIAHEVAHLWWNAGHQYDLAALSGIQWYVEGIAEYTALLSLRETYQDLNMFNRELANKRAVLSRQKLKPMVDYTWWEYAVVPYYKGTLMFQGLHNILGDSAFFQFMTRLHQIPNSVKTLDDLLEIADQMGVQKELAPFFQYWLLGVEPSDLQFSSVEQRSVGEVTELTFSLEETGLPKLEQPLTLLVEGPNFSEVHQLDPTQAPQWTLTISKPAYLIKIDPQGRYFDLNINNNRYWLDPNT